MCYVECLCVYVVSIQWGRRQEAGPFGTFWNAVPAYTIRNVPLTWHSYEGESAQAHAGCYSKYIVI